MKSNGEPRRAGSLPGLELSRRTLLLALASPALIRQSSVNTKEAPQALVRPSEPLQISGIYPHLAVFNDGGEQDRECGIGAVVVWAERLWLMTYPPHRRTGSPDKLYQIDDRLQMTVRPESVGGTHAGRMIHRETQQLVMGPYFIDAKRQVRAVDQTKGFPARITAVARHLTDPARKVYMIDMEGPIWEVDVRTLEATRLFVKPVPGWHAKGGYTGQGRLIVANNGELRTADLDKLRWEAPEETWSKGPEDAGVLAEFDGTTWTIVARRPHTEVTGPGGLQGELAPDAPVWSIGWDKRSVLLQVRSNGGWRTYRLPKGSYTYDPSHGWFTEWPRIRAIGDGLAPPEHARNVLRLSFDVRRQGGARRPAARHASALHDRLHRVERTRRARRRRHVDPPESAGVEAAVEPAVRAALGSRHRFRSADRLGRGVGQ